MFPLAVATNIGLSGRRPATVVGVLTEVPVMLAVVAVVNRSQDWYESGSGRTRMTEPGSGD